MSSNIRSPGGMRNSPRTTAPKVVLKRSFSFFSNPDAISAAINASRFDIVRSDFFYLLSWVNPYLSGLVMAISTAILVSHSILKLPLIAIVAHLLTVSMVLSGAVRIYNAFQPGTQYPLLSIHVSKNIVSKNAIILGEIVYSIIEHLNTLLSWSNPILSLRILGYTWLLARTIFSWYFTITPMLLTIFALFVIAPLYLSSQSICDSVWETSIAPSIVSIGLAVSIS
jgi:Reticulon